MIVWIIVSFFACVGLAEIISAFIIRAKTKRTGQRDYKVITLYNHPAAVKKQIEGCIVKQRLSGIYENIIFVDMGMGKEARALCENLIFKVYGAFLCEKDDLTLTIETLDKVSSNT